MKIRPLLRELGINNPGEPLWRTLNNPRIQKDAYLLPPARLMAVERAWTRLEIARARMLRDLHDRSLDEQAVQFGNQLEKEERIALRCIEAERKRRTRVQAAIQRVSTREKKREAQ